MIQWNADLARRLACSESEKRGLAPLIRRFMELDRIARSRGYQALEPEIAKSDNPLLAVGLRLVLEGLSGDALEDLLATYILVDELSGWHFLKACVTVEGLLSLAETDDPALMARKLVAYYGAERALGALEELEAEVPPRETPLNEATQKEAGQKDGGSTKDGSARDSPAKDTR